MNESQASCAQLFQCSCAELDELTRLAREAGAYGSRLTGAGWGGCTVSLVPEDQVEAFIQTIGQTFRPHNNLTAEQLHEVIFATKPSEGASGMRPFFIFFLWLIHIFILRLSLQTLKKKKRRMNVT